MVYKVVASDENDVFFEFIHEDKKTTQNVFIETHQNMMGTPGDHVDFFHYCDKSKTEELLEQVSY